MLWRRWQKRLSAISLTMLDSRQCIALTRTQRMARNVLGLPWHVIIKMAPVNFDSGVVGRIRSILAPSSSPSSFCSILRSILVLISLLFHIGPSCIMQHALAHSAPPFGLRAQSNFEQILGGGVQQGGDLGDVAQCQFCGLDENAMVWHLMIMYCLATARTFSNWPERWPWYLV